MSLSQLGPVVLVGAGKMGTALARGWMAAGLRAENLILVDPNPSDAVVDFAGQHGLLLVSEAPKQTARVLVLAVKPQIMADVLPILRPAISAETLVVSIAAGITLKALSEGLGTGRVVRCMPNTPAQVGKGMTGAIAGPQIGDADKAEAELLMSAAGHVLWLDGEARLSALTAISGCGPAYVFLLAEAMAAAGQAEGLPPDDAMTLARQTVIGAAALMEADPADAATLGKNVTSPGGVTAAALEVLMGAGGIPDVMLKAVANAIKRDKELGA